LQLWCQPARGPPPPACHGCGPLGPGQAQIGPKCRRQQTRHTASCRRAVSGVALLRHHATIIRSDSTPPLDPRNPRDIASTHEGLRQGAHAHTPPPSAAGHHHYHRQWQRPGERRLVSRVWCRLLSRSHERPERPRGSCCYQLVQEEYFCRERYVKG
jgi:hypothetical protein